MSPPSESPGSPPLTNLVRLKPRNPGRFAHTLYQEDFEKCLAQRALVRRELKELKKIENYIATAFQCGAAVEPGIYTPELIKVERREHRVKSGSYYRLELTR